MGRFDFDVFFGETGGAAFLPSHRLIRWTRFRIDGGFVLEIGDVVGPWRKSKLKADNDAIHAYRMAMDLPDPFDADPTPRDNEGSNRT